MPPQPIDRRIRALAKRVARDLFRNGAGEHAARLVLTSEDGRELGGWCRKAVEDRLATALRRAVGIWRETHG